MFQPVQAAEPKPQDPPRPPRLTLRIASPLASTSSTFPSTRSDASDGAIKPPSPIKPSRNSLFDLDWAPVTPHTRSRSSTTESQFSATSSAGTTASSKSWMDVDISPPPSISHSSLPPPIPSFTRSDTVKGWQAWERTPIPGKRKDGFEWTAPVALSPKGDSFRPPFTSVSLTQASPSFTKSPPPPPPLPAQPLSSILPPSPPSPVHSSSHSFPSSLVGNESATLPPTAGHSSNPLLDTRQAPSLRLSPIPLYSLGEGRHATVYLASFVPQARDGQVRVEKRRRLCAAKRLLPDRESQVSGLGEAFILAKLSQANPDSAAVAGSRYIIGLYGVRDERDGIDPPAPLPSSSSPTSVSRRASLRRSYDGAAPSGSGTLSPLGKETFAYGADEGEATSREDKRRSLPLQEKHKKGKARLSDMISGTSTPSGRLSLLSHALEPPLTSTRRRTTLGGGPSTTSTTPSHSSPTTLAPSPLPHPASPRIDLLLEYCPFGHVLQFARAHPQRIGKRRWFEWALQVSSAAEWAHEKGALHADLKPQNVMVAADLTLRLCDWGNSLFLPPPSSPAHVFPTDPHGLGTPAYSPPEFVHPLPSPFSYSSDVFSLGITLNTLITLREPYEGVRAVERMVRVAEGGWWEWEEGRRLREVEGEVEEGLELSRTGSVRSTRSGRSSLRGSPGAARRRRDDSEESVRSYLSISGIGEQGPREWRVLAKSLLAPEEDEAARATDDLDSLVDQMIPLTSPPSPPPSPRLLRRSTIPLTLSLEPARSSPAPPTLYYPSTSIPVQYFPSFIVGQDEDEADASTTFAEEDAIVPLAVRDLIKRMASPADADRPTAAEVRQELERVGRSEGVFA
ncbi:NIMA-related kinase 3 [Rhodotorula toruloides]|uniref:NIMA-related kinase 3 n=1 Tax=Rhodotorula toruloides TaxID=5286 RepID=A0A511KF77_RHOTO|nr:NIMA-related kinase 3 [Rhodotorula toruloides]